jgi:hypothetical protein
MQEIVRVEKDLQEQHLSPTCGTMVYSAATDLSQCVHVATGELCSSSHILASFVSALTLSSALLSIVLRCLTRDVGIINAHA